MQVCLIVELKTEEKMFRFRACKEFVRVPNIGEAVSIYDAKLKVVDVVWPIASTTPNVFLDVGFVLKDLEPIGSILESYGFVLTLVKTLAKERI